MVMSDPIADMLTRIRNGQTAKFEQVDVPSSRIKLEIARILKAEGYIKNFKLVPGGKKEQLRIFLKYDEQNKPAILGLERVSKPGWRVYLSADEIPQVKAGLGILILTTSKGLLTDKQAKKMKVGGEVICQVW